MHRIVALTPSPTLNLVSYIRQLYPSVLKEAYCPCSGEHKACPGTETRFAQSVATEVIDLGHLKMGLSGFKTAISKNKEKITEHSAIRDFLNQIKHYLNQECSQSNIATHIKLVDMALAALE